MLVPMSLRLTRPRRLMLVSLAHDPVYGDIEVQWVDEPELGGQGIVLLAVRRADGTADVLVDERLRLPRADYDVAAGLASFSLRGCNRRGSSSTREAWTPTSLRCCPTGGRFT